MAHTLRVEPRPGQESVWDYPRPPRLEPVTKQLRVVFNGVTIADCDQVSSAFVYPGFWHT